MYPLLSKPPIKWAYDKRIFVKENVINEEVCKQLIEYGQENVIKDVNKYPSAFSTSFHTCLLPVKHEIHNLLQEFWEEAIKFFEMDINFIEPYQMKRYTTDDFFGKHTDSFYSLSHRFDRKITMSIQLTDPNNYDDGELVVIGQKYKLRLGSAICFPSYFPHEVTKIAKGTRWALIGWAWGKNWR